ncbi:hypothetical protein Naga_101837g1, partial [Nannochloropsis gaditana]
MAEKQAVLGADGGILPSSSGVSAPPSPLPPPVSLRLDEDVRGGLEVLFRERGRRGRASLTNALCGWKEEEMWAWRWWTCFLMDEEGVGGESGVWGGGGGGCQEAFAEFLREWREERQRRWGKEGDVGGVERDGGGGREEEGEVVVWEVDETEDRLRNRRKLRRRPWASVFFEEGEGGEEWWEEEDVEVAVLLRHLEKGRRLGDLKKGDEEGRDERETRPTSGVEGSEKGKKEEEGAKAVEKANVAPHVSCAPERVMEREGGGGKVLERGTEFVEDGPGRGLWKELVAYQKRSTEKGEEGGEEEEEEGSEETEEEEAGEEEGGKRERKREMEEEGEGVGGGKEQEEVKAKMESHTGI